MDAHLRALCEEGHDVERLHALFRAAHTIKGSAGMFGLEAVVLRDGALEPAPSLLELLLECRDHIEDLVGRALEDDGGEAVLAP
ncbi:Hpt domain-containing protein, partial [Azoarcus sp. TTM-91]|uniref:Hpt domain-containing protein n=1 Tax=Azoarcus sp. TTM-91 TaxID=2691581 RepID=UPI002006E474